MKHSKDGRERRSSGNDTAPIAHIGNPEREQKQRIMDDLSYVKVVIEFFYTFITFKGAKEIHVGSFQQRGSF